MPDYTDPDDYPKPSPDYAEPVAKSYQTQTLAVHAQWRQWAMQQAVLLASTRAIGSGMLEPTAAQILKWVYPEALEGK